MSFMVWWTLGIVVGLTLLTIVFTGPGMWSEKWGWSIFERKAKRPKHTAGPKEPGEPDPPQTPPQDPP